MTDPVIKLHNVETPMRDGVILRGDLYQPKEGGRLPTILLRLPYGKDPEGGMGPYDPYYFAARGYNVLFQDCRGFFDSDGIPDVSGANDAEDGYDTIEWIAAQDWSDGKVGTFGLSFFGYVQLAAASLDPPHLTCFCPFQCSSSAPPTLNRNGSYAPYHLVWLYNTAVPQVDRLDISEEEKARIVAEIEKNRPTLMDQVRDVHPWTDMPAINIEGFPYFDEYMESVDGNNDPAYWAAMGLPFDFSKYHCPAFFSTGWYDGMRDAEMENYALARKYGGSEKTRAPRLLIGPWVHGWDMSEVVDGRSYGEAGSGEAVGMKEKLLHFFDCYLKGDEGALAEDAPVEYYTLIEGKWKTAKEWPVPGTTYEKWFLASEKGARSLYGDGRLTASEPAADLSDSAEDSFVSDPADPVLSELPGVSSQNGDFTEVMKREDVLCYTTAPLEEDREITGPVRAEIWASVDAEDGDFYLRLSDISPDGTASRLTSGALRLRNADSLAGADYVPAGTVRKYDISMGDQSYLLLRGHSLRLDISGTSFPAADINLGTREPMGRGTTAVKIAQHVLHDREHPSALVLPVPPKGK